MGNIFTLDALREETERRYAPTEVDLGDGNTIELASVLRLGKKDRDAVHDALDEITKLEPADEDDEESVIEWSETIVDHCTKVFRLVTPAHKKLIAKLDHEDPMIKANLFTAVLAEWIGGSQPGEAEPSPSS